MKSPRIFLVRHGESIANVDKSVHHSTPDHAIGLSERGKEQAKKAGKFLHNYLFAPGLIDISHPTIHTRIWQSPYIRTRETATAIINALPSNVDLREHINLVEQQFGLFDGYSDEELAIRFPNEYSHYNKCEKFEGRFFARMPLGESRFDVAIRVHQFFGTIMRDFDKHEINNVIVVAHGVVNRAFLMQWLHLPFEWFEAEPNPKNCSIRLIEENRDCGYIYTDTEIDT